MASGYATRSSWEVRSGITDREHVGRVSEGPDAKPPFCESQGEACSPEVTEVNALRDESGHAISSSRCAVNGQKENPLARRRYQRGYLFLKRTQFGPVWVGRYREDVVQPDGTIKRPKRAVVLGDTKQYPTRRLALRALESMLSVVNSLAYRPRPTATFEQIAAKWEATVLGQLKPSTAENYRIQIGKHLRPFFHAFQVKNIGPELVQHLSPASGRRLAPKRYGTFA
jgi:Phage integrase, N-terminal SAM-like domain